MSYSDQLKQSAEEDKAEDLGYVFRWEETQTLR